ncbi:MAG TPA: hypothetical protein DDW31_00620 [candidate division Zixibacteria bacterium]|jgi:hypothetical protein|nr:hypothetical protein [candidate division Zixibacteria bacterium]
MEVKGTGIVVLPEYVRRRHGEAAYIRWLGSLPESSRNLFQSTVRLSDWFPADESYLGPTAAACRMFFADEAAGARELGRFSADYALGGVYRMFLRLGSAGFFIGRAASMLSAYLRPCRSRVESVEDGRAVVQITELPGIHRLLEHRVAGWIQRALEIHGCREVEVAVTRSLAGGDAATEFLITWSK